MMIRLLLILTTVAINTMAQLFVKAGMNRVGSISLRENLLPGLWASVTSPFVLTGVFLYGASAIFWLVILSRVQLSWAYPMLSLSYVLIVVLSHFIFHETLGLQKLIGAVVICAGVFLVSQTPS